MTNVSIEFHAVNEFNLSEQNNVRAWLSKVVDEEQKKTDELVYIFCDDKYLHKLNVQFLNHDTYTDVITFDESLGSQLSGEIYISVERVKENASSFGVSFEEELHRVMVHGLLHLCGYKDKSEEETLEMRRKENYYLSLRA
jgi:rRNA maturation RNase YbeY